MRLQNIVAYMEFPYTALTWYSSTWQIFLFPKSKLSYGYILTILMWKPHFLSPKAIKNGLSFKFGKKKSS